MFRTIFSTLMGGILIVSYFHPSNLHDRPTSWHLTDLGTRGGRSIAQDINNHGQIVGYSESSLYAGDWRAFLWEDGVTTELGMLDGTVWCGASAINDLGQIVGNCATISGEPHAFLWQVGVLTELETLGIPGCSAADLNNRGQIVGECNTIDGFKHAVLWQDGTIVDLGTLGGKYSHANAINDRGEVDGGSHVETYETHPFFFCYGFLHRFLVFLP